MRGWGGKSQDCKCLKLGHTVSGSDLSILTLRTPSMYINILFWIIQIGRQIKLSCSHKSFNKWTNLIKIYFLLT